jgi:ferric-dicitrate binding protein FerR (iron transport regulator)
MTNDQRTDAMRDPLSRPAALQDEAMELKWRKVGMGLGGGLLVAVIVGLLLQLIVAITTSPLAMTDQTEGFLKLRAAKGEPWRMLQDGVIVQDNSLGSAEEIPQFDSLELYTGAELRTGTESKSALLLTNGAILYLAANTTVRLENETDLQLLAGRIYLDAARAQATRLRVITVAGVATAVGARFEVLDTGVNYRLRIREGQVELVTANDEQVQGSAGDQLLVGDDDVMHKSTIASDDLDWQWADVVELS